MSNSKSVEMSNNEKDSQIANKVDDNLLYDTVKKMAMAPEKTKQVVAMMRENAKKSHPSFSEEKITKTVAKSIIDKYCWLATVSGGATGLVGVIPGPWTLACAAGGAISDIAICMKIQVDMCMCLAETFGYDITTVDAQNLSFLIAGGTSIEKATAETVTKIGSKAGVRMIHTYLKGAVLQTIKEIFKKIGITFTRKALEKAAPFGIGVVIGGTANYLLTKYVGAQALKWFDADLKIRKENAAK